MLGTIVLLAACGRGATPSQPAATVDLLSRADQAEVRADALDLPFLLSAEGLEHDGWASEESPAGRTLWSRRASATLQLPFATTAAKQLLLRARCHPSLGPTLPVAVSLNGKPVGALQLTPVEQEFRLPLPESSQVPGENVLGFEAARVFKLPRGGAERRPRAMALASLETRTLESPDRRSLPAMEGGRLWLPSRSSLSFYLRPEGPVVVEVAATGGLAARPELRLTLDDGHPRVLAELRLASEQARRTTARASAPQGGFARLEVANAGPGSLWVDRLALAAPHRAAAARASLPGRPHVVFFLVDTLRADHLGAYGHPAPTSPRFDAFVSQGLCFDDAWAQSSWTRPSVASIFTGLTPNAHGVGEPNTVLAPALVTLAEVLGAAGYRTAAFVANHVISRRLGFAQGFETWNGGADSLLYGKPAAELVADALRWLDAAPAGPKFLYIHVLDPHGPYTPPAEHWKPFLFAGYHGSTNITALARRPRLDPDELRFLRSAYEGEIHETDAAFGALLDGLQQRGLLDQSLVIFTADHGEEFRDHGGAGHGHTLYQEVVHVPLAARFPRAARGGIRDAVPVQQIDLLPTLVGLVGSAVPPALEGRDLSARWLGRSQDVPPLLFSKLQFGETNKAALRAGSLKLVLNQDKPSIWPTSSQLELYDLADDPKETRNLASRRPIVARYLRGEVARFEARQAILREGFHAGQTVDLTKEELEQLHALGYLQ